LSRFLNESVYARHRRSQTKGPASCGASSIRENRAAVLPAPRQNGGDHWRCIAVSGGGNCHDRAKAPSKPGRENVAAPFQSIGFRGSPVSTLIVLPMTSVAPLEAGGHNLQNPRALCSLVGRVESAQAVLAQDIHGFESAEPRVQAAPSGEGEYHDDLIRLRCIGE
jgi:hypothetical protein